MDSLSESQIAELARLKAYFPYRIVFGVIDKQSGNFDAYAKTTMHTANKLARAGHRVFVIQSSICNSMIAKDSE